MYVCMYIYISSWPSCFPFSVQVTKKKGGEAGRVETDVDKLAEKDRGELMREQRELLMDEVSKPCIWNSES